MSELANSKSAIPEDTSLTSARHSNATVRCSDVIERYSDAFERQSDIID